MRKEQKNRSTKKQANGGHHSLEEWEPTERGTVRLEAGLVCPGISWVRLWSVMIEVQMGVWIWVQENKQGGYGLRGGSVWNKVLLGRSGNMRAGLFPT